MRTVNPAGSRPWLWSVLIASLAFAVFFLATAARISRYCPDQSPRPHFFSAIKMNEVRAQSGGEAVVEGITDLRPDQAPSPFYEAVPDLVLPNAFAICRPFHFRPPPVVL